jgi:hypothetical protein
MRQEKERNMAVPDNVRAKFQVVSIRRSQWGHNTEVQTIEMQPVTGRETSSEEDRRFWQATPSGKLELGCVNQEAASFFELGKSYYLDFTPTGD